MLYISQTKIAIFLERTHVHMTTQACSWWQSISQTKIQSFSRGLMYIWPHKHVHGGNLYPKPKYNFSREDSCTYDHTSMFIVTCYMHISNQKRNLSREDSCTYDNARMFMVAFYIPKPKAQYFSWWLMYMWPYKNVQSDMVNNGQSVWWE
jgi:hypothetical protein